MEPASATPGTAASAAAMRKRRSMDRHPLGAFSFGHGAGTAGRGPYKRRQSAQRGNGHAEARRRGEKRSSAAQLLSGGPGVWRLDCCCSAPPRAHFLMRQGRSEDSVGGAAKKSSPAGSGEGLKPGAPGKPAPDDQFTVTDTGLDGIPFAITTSVLAPV